MTNKPAKKVEIEDIVISFVEKLGVYFKIASQAYLKRRCLFIDVLLLALFILALTYSRYYKHHWLFLKHWIHFESPAMLFWTTAVFKATVITLFVWSVVFFVLGLWEYVQLKKAQNLFDKIGIKNAKGEIPKISKIQRPDEYKEILLFSPNGVSVDDFHQKTQNFVVSFKKNVTDIKVSENKNFIEVHLNSRDLQKMFYFKDCDFTKLSPYSFFIGETPDTVLSQNILELPHLLIAGTSGGGKSHFFRQTLVSLLKSTENIQLYLLDLKRGIEVVEFLDLPNVLVAENESQSVQILEKVLEEMDKRLDYLKSMRKKKFDPVSDKKDLIVVAIDEASILLGKERIDSPNRKVIEKARSHIDKLAKQARACGIHLILATQKPVKDAIDTKVLENLQGRMVFRMMSVAGSTTALGNKKAQDLGSIKGRGIWQNGNEEIELQTPFITDKEVESEIQKILEEFKSKNRKIHGKMYSYDSQKVDPSNLDSQPVKESKKSREEGDID